MSKQSSKEIHSPRYESRKSNSLSEATQMNQIEELAMMELDNEINIHDTTFTCKNITQNDEVLIRYYSHRTYQKISNN
ncbi:MAG: hypothetical protein ACRD5E_03325 [Nitrososphaeraceae archaeon]